MDSEQPENEQSKKGAVKYELTLGTHVCAVSTLLQSNTTGPNQLPLCSS